MRGEGRGLPNGVLPLPFLETNRLVLTLPAPVEAREVLDYFRQNRGHLEPWEPVRAAAFYTEGFWERCLERNRIEHERGQATRFFLRYRDDPHGPVLGACNLTNITRAPLQACCLGYSVDVRFEGQGLMREALAKAIEYAFEQLDLHRIEANYQPRNERSGRLLRRLEFVVEGYARDYLFIDGSWRDHIRTARIRPER